MSLLPPLSEGKGQCPRDAPRSGIPACICFLDKVHVTKMKPKQGKATLKIILLSGAHV